MTEFTRQYLLPKRYKLSLIKENYGSILVKYFPDRVDDNGLSDFPSLTSLDIARGLRNLIYYCTKEDSFKYITYDDAARMVLSENNYKYNKYCGHNCEGCAYRDDLFY